MGRVFIGVATARSCSAASPTTPACVASIYLLDYNFTASMEVFSQHFRKQLGRKVKQKLTVAMCRLKIHLHSLQTIRLMLCWVHYK